MFPSDADILIATARARAAKRRVAEARDAYAVVLTRNPNNEEAQLAAARGSIVNPSATNSTRVVPLDRGRTVFFYVDDFHLDPAGFVASRRVISDFIDKDMGQNDQVAIASATGQIGFLQQLTDNRTVLHSALNRLNARMSPAVL